MELFGFAIIVLLLIIWYELNSLRYLSKPFFLNEYKKIREKEDEDADRIRAFYGNE